VNYESAWRLERELAAWKPDLIIADEGHKIKTHNIAASKAMHRLGALAKYRLLLTGTPVTNKAIDIFSQYKFLDPRIFGQSFYSFRNHFFFMTGYGNHTPVLKKSMEDELTRRMHSIAFRATKKDCLDLPETTDIIRKVELEPKAMKLYQSLVKESYAELSDGEVTITNVLTKLLRLSQLTGGFIGSDESSATEQVSKAKLDVLEDIIDSALEESRKLVIIARFVPELDAICAMLEKNASIIRSSKAALKTVTSKLQDFKMTLMFPYLLDRWRLRDWASRLQRQARWCFILWITQCRISSNAKPAFIAPVSVCHVLTSISLHKVQSTKKC
jgi:hypothetical protein